jgi:hypothetical protein
LGMVVPRWLILAHGGGCALMALVTPLLNLSWRHRQTENRKCAQTVGRRAAGW